ncbi:MAG TPA: carboxypeptidase regulatory-like domain-containing protein [Polyangiaceae bacterium]|jgi:hypothetical protein|nr:carboxypeptidase regulatory-like domain-containing protein [Polyangiaceae bacterium]
MSVVSLTDDASAGPAPSLPPSAGAALDFGDPGASCGVAGCAPPSSSCPGGGQTSISGTVYVPSGALPLYNVMVYVPSAPLAPLSSGATCACEVSGEPVAAALTDTRGRFTLVNPPSGEGVPLVIQVGKWRRLFTLDRVNPCADNAVPDQTLRLPARQADGDLPRIALSTGNADALECLINKLGIDPSEFTPPGGPGRINYFAGEGGTDRYVDGMNAGAEFPDAEQLWSSLDSLRRYDVVLLSCEGDEGFDDNKPDAAFQAMFDYTNLGGRVFASHWHQLWLQRGPEPFPEIAEFVDEDDLDDITADVITSFPKGKALSEWLVNVNASSVPGRIDLTGTQYTVQRESPEYAQRWIATTSPETVQYLSANTPLGAAPAEQCGRVVLSDIHVTGSEDEGRDVSSDDLAFPEGCVTSDLSPQEKVLAYMLFDISACVVPDSEPPTPPAVVLR